MADGFELYHIPQQSRRDKLRTLVGDLQGCAGLGLLPLYDPSSLLSSSPNFLSCANAKQTTNSLMAADDSNNSSSNASDYMIGSAVIDTISNNNQSLDLQPVRDKDNGHCSFLYAHQDLRLIHHHDTMSYQPETLALSLSSHNTLEGNQPLGLNLQRYESTLGPYTGYASVLKGSKFLKPAQQLLDEICDVGFGIYAEKFGVDCGLMMDLPPLESLRTSVVDDPNYGGGDKSKKSRLISLLDEVVKMYKQYYQQIQAVIASFETVAGLNRAAPFANLDLKAMSKHFRCLNNAITDQLHFSNKSHEHHISYAKEELLYGQNVGYVDHQPVWRPQRGLPKRAVTVLRAWLFDHFLHPYPTDTDKQLLAKQTGLSRNQVSNWFINARVRLWKPMVEEVHTLETRQVHKVSSHIHDQETPPLGDTLLSRETNQNPPSKRAKNNFPGNNKYNNNHHLVEANKEQMNFYDNFSIQSGANGNRGVSLTLGLHQNNNNNSGITLSEPMSGYVMGGFDVENRHFGRGIIGGQGQFLHDFGG